MVAPPLHSIEAFERAYERDGRLLGFRSACGFVTATWAVACPRCGAADLEEVELSGRGRIAAFTVQTVPAEEYLAEAPYAYVIVDLAEGGRISGWVAGGPGTAELAIGQAVRAVPARGRGVRFERDAEADGRA
jgi:uncharacterized OB-fold protein